MTSSTHVCIHMHLATQSCYSVGLARVAQACSGLTVTWQLQADLVRQRQHAFYFGPNFLVKVLMRPQG